MTQIERIDACFDELEAPYKDRLSPHDEFILAGMERIRRRMKDNTRDSQRTEEAA
ncbi:hypothetical protein [Paracoccus yeei]|uniref:hypothetical protein n=1 Tax=Paracoccus yeei TaxID=147645 RepID=UPI0028D8AE95|nr:hypothetical protein [Paracoccus yeei]